MTDLKLYGEFGEPTKLEAVAKACIAVGGMR